MVTPGGGGKNICGKERRGISGGKKGTTDKTKNSQEGRPDDPKKGKKGDHKRGLQTEHRGTIRDNLRKICLGPHRERNKL